MMAWTRRIGVGIGRARGRGPDLALSAAGLEVVVSFAADVPPSVRDAVRSAFPAPAGEMSGEAFARIEVGRGRRRRAPGPPTVLADGDELRPRPGGGFQLWSPEAVAEWSDNTGLIRVTCADEPFLVPALVTTILLEMAHRKGWSGYHGALIAGADRALLVVGASGQGKSTTAGAGLAAGLTVAADDAVLVRPGPPGAAPVEAAGLTDLLMIPAGSGTPTGGGADGLDARGRRRVRRPPGADGWFGVGAVLVVGHGLETRTVLEPVDRLTLTRMLVVANLGDFNRTGRARAAVGLLERMTALDRYRLALGTDPGERRSSAARLLSELVADPVHGARPNG